jgi:hypothetical protein
MPRGSAAQKAGVDRLLHLGDGSRVTVQEKTRYAARPDLLIEYRHEDATGRTWPGWIRHTSADLLVYLVRPTGTAHVWSMDTLRRAWTACGEAWKRQYGVRRSINGNYLSLNVPVPLSTLPMPRTVNIPAWILGGPRRG